MPMIFTSLEIPDHELWFEFSHASGPGGQHVNKTASRATLCFALDASPGLSDARKRRIRLALARRVGKDGVLRVTSGVHREQSANRALATERFVALLRLALTPRAPRTPTRPTRASGLRRLADKSRRSAVKRQRRAADDGGDDG